MKNKRSISLILSIVIAAAGIATLSGIIIYAMRITQNTPHYFASNKESAASALYDKLTSIDFATNYPETPEAVMDLYADTVLLLYGNMIIDEGIRQNVLSIQRQLYSNNILENNTFESQYENLLNFTETLTDLKAVTTGLEREQIFFDPNKKLAEQDQCIVSMKQFITNMGTAYWNYHLDKTDGQWKINTWVMTDENYHPLT